MWGLWWVWLSGAVVLGLIEIVVPGYVFLGFALGAAITGIVLLVGGPVAGALAGIGARAGAVLRRCVAAGLARAAAVLGIRKGQIKIIDRDINED
jgi:inner membrane protein